MYIEIFDRTKALLKELMNVPDDYEILFLQGGATLQFLSLIHIYLRDRALAEDAVQDTFLKDYRSLASFRGECSEKTWLMNIAINTCCDLRRAHRLRRIDPCRIPDLLPQAVEPVSYTHLDVYKRQILT